MSMDYHTQYVYSRTRVQKARDMQIALCTCPHCRLVWPHYESNDAYGDLQRTRQEIGNPNDIWTCQGCGGYSAADILREKRIPARAVERSR